MAMGGNSRRTGPRAWVSGPAKLSSLFVVAVGIAVGVHLESDWPWWVSALVFAMVMAPGLGRSETVHFVADDSGITIPAGRSRRVYTWEQIGSILAHQ